MPEPWRRAWRVAADPTPSGSRRGQVRRSANSNAATAGPGSIAKVSAPPANGLGAANNSMGRSMNFETNPPTSQGFMSKREPQIILKTDERKIVLEMGLEGKFAAKSSGWDENRVFLEGDKLEVAVKHGCWVLTTCPLARERGWTCSELFSGRLERRCNGGDTVTETALHVVTLLPWPIVVRRACR